jgi:DNA polymerase III epsilon subunit family exonuclease
MSFLSSAEFVKLEAEYPFLRRAREYFSGLRGLSYVVVDIETTGLEPGINEIIEIAALKVEKGDVQDVFCSLIDIHRPLPPEIVRLTHITDEMLSEGEEKTAALNKFVAFIKDFPLMAHNVDFDVPFLKHHLLTALGVELKNQTICTLRLSQKYLPGLGSHKLGKVAEHFKIPAPLAHRASGDVEITYHVWLKLMEILEREGFSSLDNIRSVMV